MNLGFCVERELYWLLHAKKGDRVSRCRYEERREESGEHRKVNYEATVKKRSKTSCEKSGGVTIMLKDSQYMGSREKLL